MDDCANGSIPLPANAGEAGPVDIFRNGGKHLRVDSQVGDGLEFALLNRHGFSGESLAHALSLHSALLVVDPAGAVVAALPADGDGGVVAEWVVKYKAKVSMQAA